MDRAPSKAAYRDPTGDLFVGRSQEFDLVTSCLDMARSGQPWVVWVEGDAGSGKTSFARQVVRGLAADVRLVRAFGDELASDVMFGVADQLAPLQARSPFAAGIELLEHLSTLQDDGPVMVLVEDFHWSDQASRQALLSMTQRLDRDRVLVFLSARPESDVDGWDRFRRDQGRCARVQMSPFSIEEVAQLARRVQIRLSPYDAARLHKHTGGHPLYVWTLLSELTPTQLVGPGDQLPVPRSLALTVLAALAMASADARRLAEALAVVNRRSPLAVAALVAGIPDPAAALEQLLKAGLVVWQPQERHTPVELAHPLYRSAIYDDLLPTRRRELHRAAAEVLDSAAALPHRVAAADESDDSLADELEALAQPSDEPLSILTKARYLQWSSALTSRRDDRERRLLSSARYLLAERHVGRAAQLKQAIEACAPSPLRNLVLGMLAWAEGDSATAEELLQLASSPSAAAADPYSAAYALLRLATMHSTRGSTELAIDAANRALPLITTDDELATEALAAIAVSSALERGPALAVELLWGRFTTPPQQVDRTGANLLVTRGMLGFYAGRTRDAVEDLRRAIALSRRGARMPQLLRAHVHLSQLLFSIGDWDEALVHAQVAMSLLADEPHVWEEAQVQSAVVVVDAARGQWETAAAHLTRSFAAARTVRTPEALFASQIAQASLARAQGEPDKVVAALRPLRDEREVAHVNLSLGWRHTLASACIAAGYLEEAEREITEITAAGSRGLGLGMRTVLVQAEFAASMGRLPEATKLFERARLQANPDVPIIERALLHHAVGKHRLAIGDRREAVSELRTAWQLLEPCGAKPYLERLDADLQACGIGVNRGDQQVLDLTDREQSVAVLVARGMTNRETASQLYISEKAVEYHLGNIYGKLGINSRRDLRRIMPVGTTSAAGR